MWARKWPEPASADVRSATGPGHQPRAQGLSELTFVPTMMSPQMSAEGQLDQDGEKRSRTPREPTAWTVPLQWVAAATLAVDVLWGLAYRLLFTNVATFERTVSATTPTLTGAQLQAAAWHTYVVGWWINGVLSAVYIVLIVGSLRRWRWTYWLLLVLGPLNAWGVIGDVLILSGVMTDYLSPFATATRLVLSAGGFAIWIWFVVAAVRYGPWGMRRGLGPSVRPTRTGRPVDDHRTS